MDNISCQAEFRRSLRAAKLLVGYRSHKASYNDPVWPLSLPGVCFRPTNFVALQWMLYTLTILHYLSANTVQLTSNRSWSARNRLTINSDKTKEIVFHRPASRHLNIPPPLSDIERFTQAALLGFDITSTLSTSVYVDKILKQINQRLYLLSQLKLQGMKVQALHELFIGLIMSKITYALPACAGHLTADDRNRINAISRKALRRGVTLTAFDIAEIIDKFDRTLLPDHPSWSLFISPPPSKNPWTLPL